MRLPFYHCIRAVALKVMDFKPRPGTCNNNKNGFQKLPHVGLQSCGIGQNFHTLVKLKVIIMSVQILNASFYGFFFEKKITVVNNSLLFISEKNEKLKGLCQAICYLY